VYLDSTRDQNAGVFVVVLDDLQSKIDGYAASEESGCSFTWAQTSLSAGFHNLTIVVDGPSPQAPSTSPGLFQLNGIQYVFLSHITLFRSRFGQAYGPGLWHTHERRGWSVVDRAPQRLGRAYFRTCHRFAGARVLEFCLRRLGFLLDFFCKYFIDQLLGAGSLEV
jgi:hypothetical protein